MDPDKGCRPMFRDFREWKYAGLIKQNCLCCMIHDVLSCLSFDSWCLVLPLFLSPFFQIDLKLKSFDLNTKYFHNSEFSDHPSSFISKSETISGCDLWYAWPENRLVDSWKFVAAPVFVECRLVDFDIDCLRDSSFKPVGFSVQYYDLINVNVMAWRLSVDVIWDFRAGGAGSFMFQKLPGLCESILRSSVPKVTTWDSLTLTDERRKIVWKFQGMEIFCVEIKSFKL